MFWGWKGFPFTLLCVLHMTFMIMEMEFHNYMVWSSEFYVAVVFMNLNFYRWPATDLITRSNRRIDQRKSFWNLNEMSTSSQPLEHVSTVLVMCLCLTDRQVELRSENIEKERYVIYWNSLIWLVAFPGLDKTFSFSFFFFLNLVIMVKNELI